MTAPTSFCKCTCFGNSTIVALDAPSTTSKPNLELRPRANRKSCNDCNRQFCLGYSFCKGEKEDKVLTTCFQRDSTKDQVVVLAFIAATVGLLGYAGVRPWVDQWREVSTGGTLLVHRLYLHCAASSKLYARSRTGESIEECWTDKNRYAIIDMNDRDTQRPSTCAKQLRDAYMIVKQRCTAFISSIVHRGLLFCLLLLHVMRVLMALLLLGRPPHPPQPALACLLHLLGRLRSLLI